MRWVLSLFGPTSHGRSMLMAMFRRPMPCLFGGSGSMPGFAQTLSEQDIIDVIGWIEDKWSGEIYAA